MSQTHVHYEIKVLLFSLQVIVLFGSFVILWVHVLHESKPRVLPVKSQNEGPPEQHGAPEDVPDFTRISFVFNVGDHTDIVKTAHCLVHVGHSLDDL